jgi:putative phosphoesterase
MRVGLVADSHGLFDPKLPDVLRGSELILHAGDAVKPAVIAAHEQIAPVRFVRGNNDLGPSFASYPEVLLLELGAVRTLLVHDLGARERPKPPARPLILDARPQLVVHGHSHRPAAVRVGETLFVNPGSAGPRRFSLPRTAAVLTVRGRKVRVEFFDLSRERAAPFGEPVEAEL